MCMFGGLYRTFSFLKRFGVKFVNDHYKIIPTQVLICVFLLPVEFEVEVAAIVPVSCMLAVVEELSEI